MKIEFYHKYTGLVIPDRTSNNYYFVMNNEVYRDNQYSCESQEASVDFDTFVEEVPDIIWRIVND